MAVHMTLTHVPVTGSLKDECGLPLSCVIEPLKKLDQAEPASSNAADISSVGRCSECYAYANHLCGFLDRAWACSLCGRYNDYASLGNRRYSGKAARERCPELQGDTADLCCPAEDLDNLPEDPEGEAQQQLVRPMCVALVDTTGTEEYLELVRCSLLAALEVLPPCTGFGLATFSDKIEMHSIAADGRLSRRVVPLIEDGEEPTPVELHHVMPAQEFFAPVGSSKDAISAALESIQAGGRPEEKGCRSFGSAVQAMLRYLGSLGSGLDHPEVHPLCLKGGWLLTFLAGCPDRARGAVLHLPHIIPDQREMQYTAVLPDSNPYGYLSIMSEASKANDRSGKSQAVDSGHGGPAAWVLNPDASAFYEAAGSAAAALGVTVSVFAASARTCGLNAIQALVDHSGGCLRLYPALQQAAMPQDVYRSLVGPRAFRGLLRIRTAPEIRITKAYSPLTPVPDSQHLWQLPSCGQHAAVGFDFEYASSTGFCRSKTGKAVLQMAFQYSIFRPATRSDSGERPANGVAAAAELQQKNRLLLKRHMRILMVPVAVASAPTEVYTHADASALLAMLGQNFRARCHAARLLVTERRMRIVTVAMPAASTPAEVYAHADADALLAMLVHKIGQVVMQQGVEQGQGLLQDWLVLFVAAYNQHRGLQPKSPQEVDADLAGCEALQAVPRLVYGMLRCALMMQRPGQHPDERVALNHLWGTLRPKEIRCALYPALSSFSDLDTMVHKSHSLSKAALETSNAPIFLLDAFTEIFVYYSASCPPEIQYPPPQRCKLWRQISATRAQRTISAKVRVVREGGKDDEGLQAFKKHLLEEPEKRADGQPSFPGVVAFLDELQGEVWEFLKEQSQG